MKPPPPPAGDRPPLIVLDATEPAELDPAAERLHAAGWTLVDRLADPPLRIGRIVCRAIVSDQPTATAAVLAASWGAGLLIGIGTAPHEVRVRLLDDLGRIGPVSRRPPGGRPAVHAEAARLLDMLAAGSTLGDAARALHVSRRTADRRLAGAKRALGARTTAEAIRRWTSGST